MTQVIEIFKNLLTNTQTYGHPTHIFGNCTMQETNNKVILDLGYILNGSQLLELDGLASKVSNLF